jgi:hypothetical protein
MLVMYATLEWYLHWPMLHASMTNFHIRAGRVYEIAVTSRCTARTANGILRYWIRSRPRFPAPAEENADMLLKLAIAGVGKFVGAIL